MNELVEAGKIRCWGGLNWKAEQINAANAVARNKGLAPFSAVQLPYNLLYRGAVENKAMREACDRAQVSVHASFGLGGGLLTDKYASRGPAEPSNRFAPKELEIYRKKGVLRKVSALASLAREMEMTPAQLALAYCLKGPHVVSVLFGAKSVEQVTENLGAMECSERLDAEALKAIRTTLKSS
jgi:aryl-alcohol dehydrogenase-like predicted oxidoreductase